MSQVGKKRSKSTEVDQNAAKRTRVKSTKSRQKWTAEEVKIVLEKMKGTIRAGKNIERPNAIAYYNTLADEIGLENRDGSSVRNKVMSLKQEYDKAIKWKRETGQGVDDEQSVADYIKKICPHFDDLDEIYHATATIHPPYNMDSTDPDSGVAIQSDEEEESQDFGAQKHSIAKKIARPKCSPNSEVSSVITKRQEVQLRQVDLEEKKLDFDAKRLDLERDMWSRSASMEEKKLESSSARVFDRYEYKKELLKLEHLKLDKHLELEKFRIPQEMQLKLELAKLEKKILLCDLVWLCYGVPKW